MHPALLDLNDCERIHPPKQGVVLYDARSSLTNENAAPSMVLNG